MPQPLLLESFEVALLEDDQASKEYNQGYEEGLAAGAAVARSENGVLDATLVQTIADINFTYAEARGQILQSLKPLFNTLVERVLPHCIEGGFAGQIAKKLNEVAEADAKAPITLHLHPDSLTAAPESLAGLETRITVKTDPSLTTHAAWILHGATETLLDTDQLLEEISAAVSVLQQTTDGTIANG